jgi:hypothetical protein
MTRAFVALAAFVAACTKNVPPSEEPLPLPPSPVASADKKDAPDAAPRPCDPYASLGACRPVGKVKVGTLRWDSGSCAASDLAVNDGDQGEIFECDRGTQIRFGNASFTGSTRSGRVDVCVSTIYEEPQVDPCSWETMQTITGSRTGGLRFTYSEHVHERRGTCAGACIGHAAVTTLP